MPKRFELKPAKAEPAPVDEPEGIYAALIPIPNRRGGPIKGADNVTYLLGAPETGKVH